MDKNPINSKGRSHSFTTSCGTQEYDVPDTVWSSNYNLLNAKGKVLSKNATQNNTEFQQKLNHDVIPVKESKVINDSVTVSLEAGIGDSSKVSTNSELGKHEEKMYAVPKIECSKNDNKQNMDSSVKFFKNTVQQIFDNFYSNMRDFDRYKKKFHEILENSKDEVIMESFIKDMVHHILTSENAVSYSQKSTSTYDVMNRKDSIETDINSNCFPECKRGKQEISDDIVELEDGSSNDHRLFRDDIINDEIFNIYFINGTSQAEIKMNTRQLLSEINIKEDSSSNVRNSSASAENINRLAPKKKELENSINQEIIDSPEQDINIPVKTTDAKKNIHFDGDLLDGENRPFMLKICNYLCKMFRKLN